MYIAKLAKRPAHPEPATLGMNNIVQPLGASLLPARLV